MCCVCRDSLISTANPNSSSRPVPGSPSTPGSHSKTKKVLDAGHGRLKMESLEKMRRWKRSLDGVISFRKAMVLGGCALLFLFYVWPSFFNWLLGGPRLEPGQSYLYFLCKGEGI